MTIKCPYCKTVDSFKAVHRHLVDSHLDRVITGRDEATNAMQFTVACPFCEDKYQRQINPRGRNPRFLKEFKAEIALVAFDQMLYHLLDKHPAEIGVDPANLTGP